MTHKISDSKVEYLIRECMTEADKAIQSGNPPFGCVITDRQGEIMVRAFNNQVSESDPTGHAEINALRLLGKKLANRYLDGCIVFANASSCSMCMSACIKARITKFYYGAPPEPTASPWITMEDIADKAKGDIEIYGPILGDDCAVQILRGRTISS